MAGQFTLTCTHCEKDVGFDVDQAEGLRSHIEERTAAAYDDGHDDGAAAFSGWIDPDVQDCRLFRDLAAALARGDCAEALIVAERMAQDMGDRCQNAFELGRFDRLPGTRDLFASSPDRAV